MHCEFLTFIVVSIKKQYVTPETLKLGCGLFKVTPSDDGILAFSPPDALLMG